MTGPEFRKSRLALVLALSLTAGATVTIARSQGVGINREGIVQTKNCDDPNLAGCIKRITLVRLPMPKDQSDEEIAMVNDSLRWYLKDHPEGYQVDLITPFGAAPKSQRLGILNVFSENTQNLVLDFRRIDKRVASFRVKTSSYGIEELLGQKPLDQVYPFLASLFYKDGSPKDHLTVDPDSPYRLYLKGIRSLKDYDLEGHRR